MEYQPERKEIDSIIKDFSSSYKTGENLSAESVNRFRSIIYDYYDKYKRELPWRDIDDPYKVTVSEIMLQQTQVPRVIEKYIQFIDTFPKIDDLAGASPDAVLKVWQGLGYNRRALMLHKLAAMVISEYGGSIPDSPEELIKLPAIGKATAASIGAFAFNKPTLFIETNIRTVFIKYFFNTKEDVTDAELLHYIEAVLDREEPAKWYSALMDYGTMLKKVYPNPSRKSRHHQKQSKFEGSDRKVRGYIVRKVLDINEVSIETIMSECDATRERIEPIVDGLVKEGFIIREGDKVSVKKE